MTTPLRRQLDRALGSIRRPPARAGPEGWPGLYLGMGRHGPVAGGPQHHALILGPPRSGKTTRLLTPNVLLHPGPVVVTSTKADILHLTGPARSRLGRCWLYDPTGSHVPPPGFEPLRWSPVVGCQHWDAAVARTFALATAARPGHPSGHDVHWVERAQALLAPLLHAAALNQADLATVLSWLHRRELVDAASILDHHHARLPADILHGVALTDTRELSGIFSTADSLLAAYRSTAALHAARNPNFDPDLFAPTTDTLCVTAPATAQTQHAPLVVALLDQLRTATYRWQPDPPVLWALDEVAHIAPLPDLPATIAEGASQGLIVAACLQDLSQARHRWGPAADGLLTLFTHKLILPGINDLTTLQQLCALAGNIDTPIASTSRTNRPLQPTTTTWHTQQRPRLPIDHLATGTPGHALLLNQSAPLRVRLR